MGINTFIETKGESITYPWIGEDGEGLLVLFTRYGEGTVIHSEDLDTFPIGRTKSSWGMEYFHPFKGYITLENT